MGRARNEAWTAPVMSLHRSRLPCCRCGRTMPRATGAAIDAPFRGAAMADARARASPHTPRELTTARVQMRAQQRRKLRSALMLCSRHVSAPGMLSRVCASTRG